MSTEEYEKVMDEAIASYKQDKRERLEEHLIDMAKIIEQIFKREHPTGEYLTIAFVEGSIYINNEYWRRDKDFPIHTAFCDGEIKHRPINVDDEEEDEE